MKYILKKIAESNITIDDALWNEVEEIKIDNFPWKEYVADIKTVAKAVYSDFGITVRFETDEQPLRATVNENNGEVCTDSCVEFFLRRADSDNFINIEVNPFGAMFVGNCYPGQITELDFDRAMFNVVSRITAKTWALQLTVPFEFIEKEIGKLDKTFFGNFYKCGDLTKTEHYACWSPIEHEKPNFHLPNFFGELVLE